MSNGTQIQPDEVERARQQVLRNLIDETLQIQAAKTEEITIKKSDIDRRKGGQSAMPPDISKTLSKRDLRNLVEFLFGLK